MISIREIQKQDVDAFLQLRQALDAETPSTLMDPEERVHSREEEAHRIGHFLSFPNHAIFVAVYDEKFVGYLAAEGGDHARNKHVASIVVGILEEHVYQGVGTELFMTLDIWSRTHGIHRLELITPARNLRRIGLYRKMGFDVEGTRMDALLIDGRYGDEVSMSKILDDENSLDFFPTGRG